MKTFLTILGCVIAYLSSYAQSIKSLGMEIPPPSLSIEKTGISSPIPTDGIIDLRDLLDSPVSSLRVLTSSQEEGSFQVLDDETISQYRLQNDSLWIYGKETPLTRLVYDQPELKLTFPPQEGQLITGSTSGKGYYADKLAFTFHTSYESSVLPSGEIVLSDGSRLSDVLRVRTVRHTSFSNLASDSAIGAIREEENSWYLQGKLFPVLSSYETTNDVKEHKAFYYAMGVARDVSPNETGGLSPFTKGHEGRQGDIPPLEYQVVNHEDSHEIEIKYSSKDRIHVTFVVASINGITYQAKSYTASPNEEYTYRYNYSHLPRGEYAVRIGAANQQFSVKFNVK